MKALMVPKVRTRRVLQDPRLGTTLYKNDVAVFGTTPIKEKSAVKDLCKYLCKYLQNGSSK